MKAPHIATLLLASCLPLSLASCSDDENQPSPVQAGTKPLIYTTFYPTEYFAARIAGDRIRLVCAAPADADPLHWEPDAAAVQKLQAADLVILNGAGMEGWLTKVSLSPSRLVDTSHAFRDRFVQFDKLVHSHGPGGQSHTHEGIDAHVWPDPKNAIAQASAIRKALQRLLPDHAAELNTNFTALEKDLLELHEGFATLAKTLAGKVLIASHPAYNYLASRYGYKFVNLDLDPEVMPDAAGFVKIREQIAEAKATHMLWESLPNEAIVAAFEKQLGLTCLEFSPCEVAPDAGDYLSVMRGNLQRLRAAFE